MSLAAGLQLAHHVAHRVGPVALDDVDRVDAIAGRLAHHLALAVQDVGVDEAVLERQVAQVVHAGDGHARHPQGDDVAAGHQAGAGVVVAQAVLGAGSPAPSGVWPSSTWALCGSGQPSVLCGHSALENQVSSTSGSCSKPSPASSAPSSRSASASRRQRSISTSPAAPAMAAASAAVRQRPSSPTASVTSRVCTSRVCTSRICTSRICTATSPRPATRAASSSARRSRSPAQRAVQIGIW